MTGAPIQGVKNFSKKRRQQLDGFIVRVMEPLSINELVDTQYNALVRRARGYAWDQAARTTAYHQALLDMATTLEAAIKPIPKVALTLPSRERCVELYRKALVEQLLTPAEQKSNVEWKKRQVADCAYLPVARQDVEAAIAADEQFLAAHPIKRDRRSAQC